MSHRQAKQTPIEHASKEKKNNRGQTPLSALSGRLLPQTIEVSPVPDSVVRKQIEFQLKSQTKPKLRCKRATKTDLRRSNRARAVTATPACPSGTNCAGAQTTSSLYNGMGQRVIRDAESSQTVFVYGQDGHTLISQVQRNLTTSAITTTEHIYLPTASGPMPVAAVIAGKQYAVHSDQLNTPRRLTNSAGAPVWQWAYSAFGEVAAQALPAAGQAAVTYELRYPGQVDDGNGLFYNFHRFYDPLVGRYTQSDPIGLEGGWNRFGYVGGECVEQHRPCGTARIYVARDSGGKHSS